MFYVRNRKTKGFSLIEAMLATVVLGFAAAGVLLPFVSGASVRAEGMQRTLAAKLASDFMDKIVLTPFEQIIDTYDGYSELQGQVTDSAGVVFTDFNYSNFSRDVSCESVYVTQETGSGEAKFILATVRVYYQGSEIIALKRLITN